MTFIHLEKSSFRTVIIQNIVTPHQRVLDPYFLVVFPVSVLAAASLHIQSVFKP